jgi:glycosyltransferase involved in cell wall biosynthesis
MEHKFISCKCITYGRVNLLEEAIESFLRQDYPADRCELIIVNDYPLQVLIPPRTERNIFIYNNDTTFSTIGEKENFATERCKGDIICQWDDDDIALPNHLNNVNKYFTDETNILHWKNGIFYNEPDITAITFVGNSGIVFRKSAWKAIGGHPLENAGYDMTFIENLNKYGGRTFAEPPRKEASWMYRWSMPSADLYHQSGMGTDVEGRPNILERHSEHIERLRKEGKIPTGNISLKPHWNHDYVELLTFYTKD